MAWARALCSASCAAVGLGVGAVEYNLGWRPSSGGERLEGLAPDTLLRRADKAIVERFAGPQTAGASDQRPPLISTWTITEITRRSAAPRSGGSSTVAGSRSKKSVHADEQSRPDVLKRREDWFEQQLDLDPTRLVFLDETGATTKMARRHGRAPRGQRLRGCVPHGHWTRRAAKPTPPPSSAA